MGCHADSDGNLLLDEGGSPTDCTICICSAWEPYECICGAWDDVTDWYDNDGLVDYDD